MFRLKEMPPVRALDYIQWPAASLKAAQPEPPDELAIRAAIFHVVDNEPRLLLCQRAETDSLPGCWELPGGGVEDDDDTVLTALSREIKEETGLTLAWIIQEVGHSTRWTKVKGGKEVHFMCVTFLVEVEEVELIERGIAGSAASEVVVQLSDKEHQDYAWVTEAELKARRFGSRQLAKFANELAVTAEEAFDLQKVVVLAKQDS